MFDIVVVNAPVVTTGVGVYASYGRASSAVAVSFLLLSWFFLVLWAFVVVVLVFGTLASCTVFFFLAFVSADTEEPGCSRFCGSAIGNDRRNYYKCLLKLLLVQMRYAMTCSFSFFAVVLCFVPFFLSVTASYSSSIGRHMAQLEAAYAQIASSCAPRFCRRQCPDPVIPPLRILTKTLPRHLRYCR